MKHPKHDYCVSMGQIHYRYLVSDNDSDVFIRWDDDGMRVAGKSFCSRFNFFS